MILLNTALLLIRIKISNKIELNNWNNRKDKENRINENRINAE